MIVSHHNEGWHYRSLTILSREDELKVGQRFVLPGCEDAESLTDCKVESLDIPELEEMVSVTQPGHIQYVWPDDGTDDAGARQSVGYAYTETLGWIVGVNEARAEFEKPLRRLFQQSVLVS